MSASQSRPAMFNRLFRWGAAPLTAIALLSPIGVTSASANVTYTSYDLLGDDITITTPFSYPITTPAGQIQLYTTTGSTILAWCLDIWNDLQNSGNYSVTFDGTINGKAYPNNNGAHIGGLIVEGNSLIQANQNLVINGHTFDVADESTATQVAIWLAEYGASGFAYTSSEAGFSDLVAYIDSHAGTSDYFTLDPNPRWGENQKLGFVPGPMVGTGLPGLLAGCAGLIALARRRRRAVA